MSTHYYQIYPGAGLPDISALKPFLAVVVIEESVTPEWVNMVSKWIVKSGCLYMMAWGSDCEDWHDSVDLANIEQFNYGDIPEDDLVMTSGHEAQTLIETFSESKDIVSHSCVDFTNTLILHISNKNKENEFLLMYSGA
jgi:hypothetical protein